MSRFRGSLSKILCLYLLVASILYSDDVERVVGDKIVGGLDMVAVESGWDDDSVHC